MNFFDLRMRVEISQMAMNNADQNILRVENLSFSVEENKTLLDKVSFEIRDGERLVILGPSGAGKTTLLRLVQRLDEPTEGSLFFRGRPYHDLSPTLLRRKVSLVFQEPAMFDGTVADNLRIHERLGYREAPFSEEDLSSVMDAVGLPAKFLSQDTQKLSTGETKRVSIARALLGEPEALLLDEPTANLDPTSAAALLDTLKHLSRSGLTLVCVMHQVEHARRIATRAILLVQGAIVEEGEDERFFSHPEKELTRRFLRGELK